MVKLRFVTELTTSVKIRMTLNHKYLYVGLIKIQ